MTDRCDQWLIKPARLAVAAEITCFPRSFDQFTSDINFRISTIAVKKKKENGDSAINLFRWRGGENVYLKRFYVFGRNERRIDFSLPEKRVACCKIKRESRAWPPPPLFVPSNGLFLFLFFIDQLCTCVYYLYIDSMMLFCGALHVSIGLCMSYRPS